MKYSKEITINIGNYQNVRLMVSDANSFDEIDIELIKEMKKHGFEHRSVV